MPEDLRGATFGRLTVCEKHGKDKHGYILWLCHCSCGTTKIVRGSSLRRGISRSCGCLQREVASKTSKQSRHKRQKHNEITIHEDTAFINLPDGSVALIDSEDVSKIAAYNWGGLCGGGTYVRSSPRIDKERCYLHRLILGIDANSLLVVDHIDGDPLNNKKSNLQICSQSVNMQKSSRRAGLTGFRGVVKTPPGKFAARINVHNSARHLGTFSSAEEAARAYDKAAIEIYGVHARINGIE